MTKNKKTYIIVTLILLLALYNNFEDATQAQMMKQQVVSDNINIISSRYEKLLKENNWQIVSKYWKELNHFEEINANTDLNTKREHYTIINNKVYANLKSLKDKQLITNEEVQFLSYYVDLRLFYLEKRYKLIICRRMLPLPKVVQDLELRFDIIENVFKEGKINSKTYITTKLKIQEDLKALNSVDKQIKYNQNFLNLLLHLNM